MKKLLIGMMLVLGMATSGWALSFTYDLNQKIDGGPPLTSIASLGKITISDNTTINGANWVDVSVVLNSGLRLQEFELNFLAPYSFPINFIITGADLKADLNKVSADGYKGKFDIGIPNGGNLGVTSFLATIKAGANDLNASYFDVLDSPKDGKGGLLHVAAHIAKGDSNLPGGVESLWAGDGDPTTPVPEPGTMVLLGAGLLGLAIFGKRRMNA